MSSSCCASVLDDCAALAEKVAREDATFVAEAATLCENARSTMPIALVDLTALGSTARLRGIGRYVAELAAALAQTARGEPGLQLLGVEQLPVIGPAEITVDLGGAAARALRSERRAQSHLAWAYRLRLGLAGAARRVRADVVHTPEPEATPLGPCGCPRVTTCHDLVELHYPDHYASWRDGYRLGRRLLDHRRYHSADHVIAVSEATAHDLMTMLGVPAARITVVLSGADLSRWSPEPQPTDAQVRARLGLGERPYLLYVGGADWRKNHEGMLGALAIARSRSGTRELELAWAGKLPATDRARVLATARSLELEPALRLLDFVPDAELGALYRGAVGNLFVSRAEGFGYPVLEAMAAGCPVVASHCSSIAEVAGDAALGVDPEDHEAIAEAIVAIGRSADERRRWRERGLARAQHFGLERMGRETLAVYRRLCRG